MAEIPTLVLKEQVAPDLQRAQVALHNYLETGQLKWLDEAYKLTNNSRGLIGAHLRAEKERT